MLLPKAKKGATGLGNTLKVIVFSVVGAFLGLILFLQLAAQFLPEVARALGNISNLSGIPLVGLLSPSGIAMTLIVVVVFIVVILIAMKMTDIGGR